MIWESVGKYRNRKTEVDGYTFDSIKEGTRWQELRLMEKQGIIKDLERQVKYELIPKTDKFRACNYIADFVYTMDGKTVIEDVKGYKRGQAYQVFLIKKKLVYQIYGIDIVEV